MSVAILIVLATITGVLATRREEGAPPQSRIGWARLIAYWLFTVTVAFELAAGALWAMLRIEYVRVVLGHLGYPRYLLTIFAVCKLPAALALLVPRFPRLKEWAYAGAFSNYTGATASHLLSGSRGGPWYGPWVSALIFSAFTLASWALRPPSRRLGRSELATTPSAFAWSAPVLITAAMVAVAFMTLPKGAPPQ
jgi:hypothetical protein